MTQYTRPRAQCNAYGAYSFVQQDSEGLSEAAIRAAQRIIECGLNKVAHYRGTNHVAANNAAFAFTGEVVEALLQSTDPKVKAAAELIKMRQDTVAKEEKIQDISKDWGRNKREATVLGQLINVDFVGAYAKQVAGQVPLAKTEQDEDKVRQGLASLCDEFESAVLSTFLKTDTDHGRKLANAFKNELEDRLAGGAKQGVLQTLRAEVTSMYDAMDKAAAAFEALPMPVSRHPAWVVQPFTPKK